MVVRVRPGHASDVPEIAPRLRKADLREIQALTGESPEAALQGGLERSTACYAATVDDSPEALFGYTERQPGIASIWLLGTPELFHGPTRLSFLRMSQEWIQRFLGMYEVLFNLVDERNTAHIRWLSWLGAEFPARHEAVGVEERPFLEFIITGRANVSV